MAEDNKPFIEEVKDYIKVEVDILKISLLEKISKLMTFVIGIVLAAIMATVAIAYFSVMLFNLFNQMTFGILGYYHYDSAVHRIVDYDNRF